MLQKLLICLLVMIVCLAVAEAQFGGGGYDPLVGGPNRQWRRYYRCLNSGYCPYDYETGHYFGRRELNRMSGGMGGGFGGGMDGGWGR
ncbi:hypothetical protein DdX_18106 [Ditylenchus destructor]|uniref:Uncharacterized protein n=1 Tax=Ditylenchus destructor TaxID=166010 RepID=A0AAD4QYE0_9BILA|nr:hypothetical protein DdX_18106 [Ditylenchus destructor]